MKIPSQKFDTVSPFKHGSQRSTKVRPGGIFRNFERARNLAELGRDRGFRGAARAGPGEARRSARESRNALVVRRRAPSRRLATGNRGNPPARAARAPPPRRRVALRSPSGPAPTPRAVVGLGFGASKGKKLYPKRKDFKPQVTSRKMEMLHV